MDDCIYMYLQVWWKIDRISITILLLNIKDIQRLVFFCRAAIYDEASGGPTRMDVQKAEHLFLLVHVKKIRLDF